MSYTIFTFTGILRHHHKEKHTKLVALANEMTRLNNELQKLSPNTDQYNRINKEVEKTDSLIDEEIYKLYSLTAEEIATMEE